VQIDPRTSTSKNPPEQFTGDVWLDPIASPRQPGQRMVVAWVQSRGSGKVEAYPGQTIPPP
jgi:hypothetical protein